MDRSQEKSSLLSTKVHSLDAKTANPRQQFAHEAVTTNPIFRPLKAFPPQATLENGLNPAGFSSSEVAIGRNSEQFISPLQAQYYQQTVPSAALGMSLPYGMIAGQGMDPRALNAGNLLYTYGNPVMSFPNFSTGYGQGQRVKNSEETAPSDKTSRPTEPPGRSSKEPMRTESVIKTVTDKQEAAKKPSDIDKRNPADSQVSNIPLRYPDRGKGSEFGNSDDGKNKGLPLRDVPLRDTQSNEDMSRRDKQLIADYDRTRDKLQKAKVYDHLAVDSGGNKRPSNGLTSRVVENGGVTFSSHDKSYTTSESRSSPYPANEPPTLVPYHNVLPSRTTSSTTNSSVPSTMPKLTPIAPRMSNGSPLTVPYSSEGSSPYTAWRQSYPYPMNPASSASSVTSHSGVVPWTTNYPSKPPQGEKVDENNWRTKQPPREERDLNRKGGYEHVQKPVARNFYPLPSNERPTYYGALPPQLRAPGTEKSFGGKDVDDDSRDASRDPSREAMTSSEQSKLSKGAFKFGVGQGSLRKEPDIPSSKLTITGGHEDYQRSQPFVNRNEKSVVGEYVKDYNSKSDDGKGSLAGNVIVHSKESGSYRLSVEKRDGKYKYPEMAKSSRVEENRPTSGSYSGYDGREQSDANFMGVPRAEPRSSAREVREDKEKESADRARPVDHLRANDQSSYKEHAGRKPDSRDIPTVSDGKKSNDRNNNSTAYGAFPFFKYGAGGFPSVANGEQLRYVERSGAVSDDKVFVPPNATIEMYERREQEMEKNGLRKTDFTAYARNMESNRMSNSADDGTIRNDDRRVALTRDEPKPKLPTGRFENEKRSEREEISSDENDDATRHVSREALSPDKRAQLRPPQPSDRTVPSPAAGALRQRRLSSPLSDQRSTSAPNPYGASLAPGLHSRRAPSDGSESHSRDSAAESGLSGLGNPGAAQYLRMDGAAFGNPYFAPFLAAPQGMSEAPFMLVDPSSIYGAMYRPPMIEAAPPGMFPPGALAADPMTGQIMMIPPEAYIPMVTADNAAFMNPMMDPRYAGMWGVPGGIDEAQWQQLYQQMMQPYQQQHKQQQAQSQQQQQQQLHERNKQFLLGKQGTPFPFPGNPFYYGEKHFDKQQKGESKDGKPADQQQKAREETQEHAESQAKEPAPRQKPETATPQEHVQRVPASRDTASRNSEFVQQQETSNQREEKPAIDSRWLKEAHQKLTEKHSAVQAQLDAQGQFAKQLKDYLSRDPFSQFPFPAPQAQAPFPRDVPKVNLTVPTTNTSARPPEVDRNSASPKTVSAAVTLSAMEKARGEDSKWTTRLPPSSKNDAHVVSSQNSVVDRVRSPRLWTGAESMITKEIVETPRKLEAQPNLVGERVVSRESREVPGGQMPLQFPHKLMALGNIASERPVQEKPERESEGERFESYYRVYDRGLPVSYNEVSRNSSDKTIAPDLENRLPIREQPQRIDSYGEIINSFVKSGIERTDRGLQPANVRLRENLDSLEENRGNFQAVISHEKPLTEGFDSDSEFEDDFNTRCELRRIASSFVPLKTDLENKENSTIFSLRPFRSEAERKQIRENIDRLRSMAKRRSSKDRFMVFSRRRDVRSPTTILNSVTSAISDVAGVESVEKEMRLKLAELQKKYREKVRELARLQPKYGADDGTGKSTPIKRGPGRPRKRKYFGAGTKGEKSSPVLASDFNKEGEESLPVSGTQSPELNAAASESESLVSKDSEPPTKKKKRAKQKSPVEREERASAPPSRGLSPVESAEFSVPVQKKKKSRKPTPVEDEAVVQPSKDKPTSGKKKGPGTGKRRKGSPTEDSPNQQTVPQPPTALSEISTNELDNNAEFAEPKNAPKTTKVKKQKPKKRARPKLTIETPEGYDDEKPHDEVTPDSADRTCETPRAPTPTKGKRAKAGKKKRKSTSTTPPKEKFEFPDVTSQDDSLSENNSSVSPKDIGKEVAMAARKEMEAQRNMREASSDVDDDVFTPGHDGRDGLSLLAQASFASIDKPSKRKRSEAVSPTDDKKKGRPKKPSESPPYEPDAPVVTKKKKKKKIAEEDSVKEPKRKKKKKKKDIAPKEEEKLEEKPAEEPQAQPDPEPLPMEQHDELDNTKLPDTTTVTADIEQDEEVFRPATEQAKEIRTTKSDPDTPRESDEFKGSMSSLLSDEWQPRRSERIFINSSVTTSSSSSPLSPTGKGSEFSYTKKPKRMSLTKGKPGRSGSLGEEDLEESDVIPLKAKAKPKKKKGPGKGKKRSSSTAADFDEYEPSKVSRRARSKSRQTIDFDDADEEEEADELQEEEEPHEEAETDVEINVTDKMEASEEQAEEVPAPPDVSAESGSDFKPETEVDVEQMETEKIESKEVADVEMKEEEEKDEKNVIEVKKDVEESEKPEEKESEEEPAKEEENEEKEEAVVERPASPVDVRFTFVIDELVEGVKLLLPVDSVFYPGRINTFNEPDLFGVILDGERGRRPHWKSTEQLLNEAVKDVQPPSDKFLSIGTRVCAHWSPQYRCFYPGTVTEAPPDEKEVDGKIWIEFDDGDSGFFQLNEIKRIHPDFPVEDVESTPSLPEKRPRSSSLGAGSQSTTARDSSSRLRLKAEENFSSGNESSGEVQAKRRRLRGKRKSKDDSWLPSKHLANSTKESGLSKSESFRSRTKEVGKSDSETTRVKDKSSSDSQENKVTDIPKQKANRMRGKTETKVENKEAPPRTAENTKQDLATVASAELKESEKEIHSSDSSIKRESYENNSKQSSEKTRAALGNTTESDDSEATSDVETSKHDKGTRAASKGSSRTSEKDLRRRSLNLSLSSSFRSSRAEGESPTRDVMSTSQDEDSESYSDTFDESPLVENKSFQPRLGRRRRSELDRLQVDMKCSGPLWQWSGRSFQNKRKGKGKKSFYKAIVRGDETICVGDCAVFTSNPTKNLNLPYVGRIESMWEGCVGNMVVRVKWFYHPEETKPGRKPSDGKQSLYRSTHVDENDVQTISHKCEVLTPEEFKKRSQSLDTPSAKNRVFCCIGSYDPNNETLSTEL